MEQGYPSSGRPGMGPHYGGPIGGPHMPPRGPMPPSGIIGNQAQPQVVTVVAGQNFGTKPISLTCQFCKNPVTTTVQKKCSCGACCLCWFTGLFIWICIQCCRNKEINCYDATHLCPSCGQQLGTYTSC